MIGRRLAVCSLFFVAALIPTASGATDDPIKVEAEQPRVVANEAANSILGRLKLVFDARFTNLGDAPVEIPDRLSIKGVAGISENGVDSQQSDGSWRTVNGGGDLMWIGHIVFPLCKVLSPKETLVVKGVWGPLVDSESNRRSLSPRATIRAYLVLPCKQRDGKVVSKIVKTDPFVLSIPPLP
jgi:hypothetical protein